jgi:TRAP-type C4-dicarboxylate transport system permease small subunit
MYIVAIGWIYVVLMMSISEASVTAGLMTFLIYGILPLGVILYLLGTPERRRRRAAAENSGNSPEPGHPTLVDSAESLDEEMKKEVS